MVGIHSENFEIVEFYCYPTCVVARIAEYSTDGHGDEDIKDLFDELIAQAEQCLNRRDLRDNKVAMKVIYKPTGHVFYVGYKDWKWALGLALNPHMTGKCIKLDDPAHAPLIQFT